MSGRGKSTPLTPEQEARRVERTSAFRNRQLVVESRLGAPGLFFVNCGRCGTDIYDDTHVASSSTDEEGKRHVTYYGVFCRQDGRPRNPQAREEAAEKGHDIWMGVTEDLMARWEAATGEGKGVMPEEGMEVTLDVEDVELENTKKGLAAALDDLAKVKCENAKKMEQFEAEIAKAKKECEELGTSMKAELESAKNELASLKSQLERAAVEKSGLQHMYTEAVVKIRDLEARLAGDDPLAFMSAKRAATTSATKTTSSGKRSVPVVSFSEEAEGSASSSYASAAAGEGGAAAGAFGGFGGTGAGWGSSSAPAGAGGGGAGGLGGAGAGVGGFGGAEAFWGRCSTGTPTSSAPRGGPTIDPTASSSTSGPRSASRGPDASVREEDRRMRTLMSSTKLIRCTLKSGKGIVDFMVDSNMLQENINEFFGDESEDQKIKIALLHMDEAVRTDADEVYRNLRVIGVYDLKAFMAGLFNLNYPSPWSSLDLAFRGLKQGELSIIDYARRFKLFVGQLELNLKGQVNKFMLGLKDPNLRSSLYKQNLEGMEFDDIVKWAVTLTNNLKLERGLGASVSTCVEFDLDETCLSMGEVGLEYSYKIMGVPLGVYLRTAEEKNVRLRCFNCFGSGHGSVECGLKICKFCEKEPKKVKHYSLMCPRAPKNLGKFLEERDKYKASKKAVNSNSVIADEFKDYHFDSDELSD